MGGFIWKFLIEMDLIRRKEKEKPAHSETIGPGKARTYIDILDYFERTMTDHVGGR